MTLRRPSRFNLLLLLVWGALLAGTLVCAALADLLLVPLIGVVALPFVPFPTAFVYFSSFLVAYALASAALHLGWKDRGGARAAAVAAGVVVVAAAAYGIPLQQNMAVERQVKATVQADHGGAFVLAPTDTVALVDLHSQLGFEPDDACSDLCVALLRSGRARNVLVAHATTDGIDIPPDVKARRFALKGDQRDCVAQDQVETYFRDKPRAEAQSTGGYPETFVRPFLPCIADQGRGPEKGDLTFVNAWDYGGGGPTLLGIDWGFRGFGRFHTVRVLVRDGDQLRETVRMTHFSAPKLLWPLRIDPVGSASAIAIAPGGWSVQADASPQQKDVPLDAWGLLANADDIYADAFLR